MKKSLLLVLFTLLSLSSCRIDEKKDQRVYTVFSDVIGTNIGRVRVRSDDPGVALILPPFRTSITATVYYYDGGFREEELEALDDAINFDLQYYYALSDRHYDYTLDGEEIVNVKTINEAPRGTAVAVDPFLFDLLKESYEFSLNTADDDGNLLFDIFAGNLNGFYEEKLSKTAIQTPLDKALSMANNAIFSSDVDQESLDEIIARTPVTKEEAEGLLEFDEANSTVTFQPFVKNGITYDDVEISLSAVAKGFATERISEEIDEEYPDISLLINSGSSSIKAIGEKPDGKSWNIRLTNPYYDERAYAENEGRNPYEVGLRHDGPFTMSTSGYYGNYFYVYDPEEEHYLRRDHIIYPATGLSVSFFDQVSVFNEDAGLADMYTTTLMLSSSVQEALDLIDRLDAIYELDTESIFVFKSVKEDALSGYSYKNSELTPLSSLGLPIVNLKDKVRYEGDYTDIAAEDIQSSVSRPERDFRMTYLASSGVYGKLELVEDENSVPYPEKRLAVLKEEEK